MRSNRSQANLIILDSEFENRYLAWFLNISTQKNSVEAIDLLNNLRSPRVRTFPYEWAGTLQVMKSPPRITEMGA